MPRLIVNADDLGQQGERDAAILELHQEGALSSASLVVNGAHTHDAVASALDQGLPLGLHLNLSEGFALTTELGALPGKFAARAVVAGWSTALLRREIAAQLDRFVNLCGKPPTHVDGHHHIHVAPAVLPVLLEEMRARFSVQATRPALRVPRSTPAIESISAIARRFADDPRGFAFYRQVQDDAACALAIVDQGGWRRPAGFFGIALTGAAMTTASLKAALDGLSAVPEGIYELMCHPGFPAAEGDSFVTSVERQREFASLLAVFGNGRAPLPLTDFSALSP